MQANLRNPIQDVSSLSAQMAEARTRVAEELVDVEAEHKDAGKLTQSIARLCFLLAQMAEARTREAEKQVGVEVEHRLAAVAANRALWPPAIHAEVSKLEARLDALQV